MLLNRVMQLQILTWFRNNNNNKKSALVKMQKMHVLNSFSQSLFVIRFKIVSFLIFEILTFHLCFILFFCKVHTEIHIKLCSYDFSVEEELEHISVFHTQVLPSEVSIHCPPLTQTPKSMCLSLSLYVSLYVMAGKINRISRIIRNLGCVSR